MATDVFLDLLYSVGCTPRLCLSLELGLEVVMDIIFLSGHPGCDASVDCVTCQRS